MLQVLDHMVEKALTADSKLVSKDVKGFHRDERCKTLHNKWKRR